MQYFWIFSFEGRGLCADKRKLFTLPTLIILLIYSVRRAGSIMICGICFCCSKETTLKLRGGVSNFFFFFSGPFPKGSLHLRKPYISCEVSPAQSESDTFIELLKIVGLKHGIMNEVGMNLDEMASPISKKTR